MEDKVQKINNVKIEEMIYEIRGHYVMLDSDLAELFEYKDGAKAINKSVKRHIELFSKEIYFQLLNNEWNKILDNINDISGTAKVIFGTANMMRFLPYAFTLEGIKILSSILRKPNVQSVTLEIVDAFENIENKNNRSLTIPVSKRENLESLIFESRGV